MKNIDVIGIVALAFFLEKFENYEEGLKFFEEKGIEIIPSNNTHNKYFNTTATVEKRIEDLEEKFLNKDIDMIVSMDGGCTVIEMLDKINYKLIKNNHKFFTGFSDLTHLQIAMYTKSNLPSLYGMDIINGFGNRNEYYERNIENFFKVLNAEENTINNYEQIKVINEGNASGTLIGGWLTAVANLIETEYWPEDENVILFLEEVECEPHLINLNLQRIKISKKMSNIKGIIFGEFTECEEKEYWDCIPSIDQIIANTFKEYNIPILGNFSFGHGKRHLTIPIGIKAEIDSRYNNIKLLEKFKLGGK